MQINNDRAGNKILVVKFSPDGKYIATAGSDRKIRVYNTENKKKIYKVVAHFGTIWCLTFSPDSKFIISGSGDFTMAIYTFPITNLVKRLEFDQTIATVNFSEDGKTIYCGSANGMLHFIDFETHSVIRSLELNNFWISSMIVFQDHFYMDDGRGWLNKITKEGTVLKEIILHDKFIHQTILSPDNSKILTTSQDRTLKLYEFATEKVITFCGHTKAVINAFFINENLIFSISSDNTYKIWDAHTGNCLMTKADLPVAYHFLNFDQKSKHLVLLTGDSKVYFYENANELYGDLLELGMYGKNFHYLCNEFQTAARTFLLCCQRHRNQQSGVLANLPRDMRQEILIKLSHLF